MARPASLNKTGNFHVEERHGDYILVFEYNGKKKELYNHFNHLSRQGLYYQKRKLQREFDFFRRLMDIDV